jgi:hypothetical protein
MRKIRCDDASSGFCKTGCYHTSNRPNTDRTNGEVVPRHDTSPSPVSGSTSLLEAGGYYPNAFLFLNHGLVTINIGIISIIGFDKIDGSRRTCRYACGSFPSNTLIAQNRLAGTPIGYDRIVWADHDAHRAAYTTISVKEHAPGIAIDRQCHRHTCGDTLGVFAEPANRLVLELGNGIPGYLNRAA